MLIEEGKTYVAVMFTFPDGYMFRWTPGGIPVQATGGVKFDTSGKPDEFGVPPHKHEDVKFSPAPFVDGSLEFLVDHAKSHGPPQSMSTLLFKRVGRHLVQLYEAPVRYGQGGYVVMALAGQSGKEGPEGGGPSGLGIATTEEALDLANRGATVTVPDHDHWFASEKSLPFSAALWIYRSVTEENIAATNCNCTQMAVRRGVEFLGPDLPDLGVDLPDEAFIGDDTAAPSFEDA